MCGDWGYEKLHEAIEQRSIQEMKHAERLIERILFLEGRPIVSELNKINIGESVLKMLEYDLLQKGCALFESGASCFIFMLFDGSIP